MTSCPFSASLSKYQLRPKWDWLQAPLSCQTYYVCPICCFCTPLLLHGSPRYHSLNWAEASGEHLPGSCSIPRAFTFVCTAGAASIFIMHVLGTPWRIIVIETSFLFQVGSLSRSSCCSTLRGVLISTERLIWSLCLIYTLELCSWSSDLVPSILSVW